MPPQLMNGFVISYNEMPVYWKWCMPLPTPLDTAAAAAAGAVTFGAWPQMCCGDVSAWRSVMQGSSTGMLDSSAGSEQSFVPRRRFNRITPTTWILQALASDQLGDINTRITTFDGALLPPSPPLPLPSSSGRSAWVSHLIMFSVCCSSGSNMDLQVALHVNQITKKRNHLTSPAAARDTESVYCPALHCSVLTVQAAKAQ